MINCDCNVIFLDVAILEIFEILCNFNFLINKINENKLRMTCFQIFLFIIIHIKIKVKDNSIKVQQNDM